MKAADYIFRREAGTWARDQRQGERDDGFGKQSFDVDRRSATGIHYGTRQRLGLASYLYYVSSLLWYHFHGCCLATLEDIGESTVYDDYFAF
jgi:hypothetical protein